MLALLNGSPPRLVDDHPLPSRAPGEARVRVRVAGICDTDLQLARGYMGYRGVLGHELVGEVVETDARDHSAWLGQRVVADINAGCGACVDCRERDGHHCATRTVLGIVGRDGALAEELVIPTRCLVAVPDGVSDTQAVFAEPLAAALHVLDEVQELARASSMAGGAGATRAVVLGDGKLGLLIAHALRSAALEVLVVGHHESKLALARAVGARAKLERDVDPIGEASSLVVEATGSAAGLALALSLTRPRGTLVLKTTVAGPTEVDLSPIVVNELRVIGSRCGDLRRAIDALARGGIDPSALVSARYPLAQAEAAMVHAATKGALKVLVDVARG
jgi:threonine dehydrogenase-like Zn-dependent dehydrogenase